MFGSATVRGQDLRYAGGTWENFLPLTKSSARADSVTISSLVRPNIPLYGGPVEFNTSGNGDDGARLSWRSFTDMLGYPRAEFVGALAYTDWLEHFPCVCIKLDDLRSGYTEGGRLFRLNEEPGLGGGSYEVSLVYNLPASSAANVDEEWHVVLVAQRSIKIPAVGRAPIYDGVALEDTPPGDELSLVARVTLQLSGPLG